MSRVKMPHNNRVSSSGALKMNDIWSKTIGYDPYATLTSGKNQEDRDSNEKAESLMLLARMSNFSGSEVRGGCKKCGMLGHLTFQCRNQSSTVEDKDESDFSSSDDDTQLPVPQSMVNDILNRSTPAVEINGKRDRTRTLGKSKKKVKKSKKDRKHKHKKDRI